MKPPVEGKRTPVGLRIPAGLKRRIDTEAFRQGRAVADEVEARLEASFIRQDLLTETMALTFGEQTAALLQLIGYTMELMSAARALGGYSPGPPVPFPDDGWPGPKMTKSNWLDDRDYYDAARGAIGEILDALKPPHWLHDEDDMRQSENPGPEGFGRATGRHFIELLADTDTPRWRAIRAGLGELASRAKGGIK